MHNVEIAIDKNILDRMLFQLNMFIFISTYMKTF